MGQLRPKSASYPEFDLFAELREDEAQYRDRVGFIYLLACEDSAGASFVKIGCTKDPASRLSALLTACPLEPTELAICEVYRRQLIDSSPKEREIEGSIHRELGHKRVRGEWFALDLKSPTDKAEFTAAWKAAMERHSVDPRPWRVMSMVEFRKRRREASLKTTKAKASHTYMQRMALQRALKR